MSKRAQNIDNFFKYMSKPLSPTTVDLIYVSNNVVFERADLYCNFMRTINDLIVNTYMGDDIMDDEDQNNHFNWCWNKTCLLLKHNNIDFTNNIDAYKYFHEFYMETFYKLRDKDGKREEITQLGTIWEFLFDYNNAKSKSDIDSFLSIYKIFEKSYQTA